MYEWNAVKLNIYISQGSAATEFMCGGRFYFTVFHSLSTNLKVKELLKSVHICQSYCKNKSGTFLWPTVYIPRQPVAPPMPSLLSSLAAFHPIPLPHTRPMRLGGFREALIILVVLLYIFPTPLWPLATCTVCAPSPRNYGCCGTLNTALAASFDYFMNRLIDANNRL